MSRETEMVLSGALLPVAAPVTLHDLCHEIVMAEIRANLWIRQGIWDRGEWWAAYYERLHGWHFYWIRGELPQLQRCPACQRIDASPPGYLTCFACGSHWLSRV